MDIVYILVWAVLVAALFGLAAGLGALLHEGARSSGTPPVRARRTAVGVQLGVVGLALASAGMAGADLYHQEPGERVPWLGVALVTALAGTLLVTRVPVVTAALRHPRADTGLVLPHALRVVGIVFLLMMLAGELPAAFALPAGLGDIAVGIAAPFVARRLARGDRRGASLFHVFGLLDLVAAVTLGVLTAPGPLQQLHVSPPSGELAVLPLALIPTVLVPIYVGLHVVALRRLARDEPKPRRGPRRVRESAG